MSILAVVVMVVVAAVTLLDLTTAHSISNF